MREPVLYGSVYLFLALINLRVKLSLTPAWFDGMLERNHHLLLAFQYTNNEQSRLLQFYIPESFKRLLNLSVPHAYIVQWWLFVFLALLCFHFYLRKWFDSKLAFAGVLFLAAIMPLTYRNHLQMSAPLLLLTFLLALWAIRDHHTLWYMIVLAVGALNNETMLALVAVFFFYNYRRLEGKHLIKLGAKTMVTTLPAFVLVGTIRYVTRDRPHLGGFWHLSDNAQGIWEAFWTVPPFDYWQAFYLHIFFLFGMFWLYALLKYARNPKFLQRAALIVPFFILAHLAAGIITEVRLLLPLSFILIPMGLFYLFPRSEQDPDPDAGMVKGSESVQGLAPAGGIAAQRPGFVPVLFFGLVVAMVLVIGARILFRYPDPWLAAEPLRATAERLQSHLTPEQGLICREIEVCNQINMYVPRLDTYWLPSTTGEQADSLWTFAAQHPLLWSVERAQEGGGHDLSVERWLGERYGKVSQEWADSARVARFVSVPLPEPKGIEALFGDQIRLSGYTFNIEGPYLALLLVWGSAETIDVSYKPFIHIVDASGGIVAQNDQFPVGDFSPPTGWQPAGIVHDLHGLILSADASGEYKARIGWYDPATGERLKLQAPSELLGDEYLDIELSGP